MEFRPKISLAWFSGALSTALLICASSLAFGAPKAKPDPCGPRFTALLEAERSPAARAIEKLIAKRFEGVPDLWIEGKKRPARLEKLFQDLLALEDPDRAELLKALKQAYPNIEEAPLLARIGLNEPSGWQKFFEETSSTPTLQPLMIGELRPFVERMPESTRLSLLRQVGERYPTAGKVPEGAKKEARFFPKRLLDGWLRVLLRGDSTFQSELARGRQPLEAYQKYLTEVKTTVFKGAAKEARYGELSAKDLLGLAEEIQRYLHEPLVKKHLYQLYRNKDGTVDPPSIRLFGSTVKGTSRRGSDIDVGYSSLNGNFFAGGERLGEQVPGLKDWLAPYLATKFPELALSMYGHAHFNGTIDQVLTALEPFMIEIKPDSIELMVFPREIVARKLPHYKGPAIYQAPAPTRYRLK